MGQPRPAELARVLAGEPLRPAYLVAGSEPLLVLEACDAIRARAREEGYTEREVFDVERGFSWDALFASLGALSLFATRRVFDVRLPTGNPGKDGSAFVEAYCANPPPDTVLLVSTGEWSKKLAGKWSERIASAGHLVECWPVKPHELPEWIARRLRTRGLQADDDAARVLADRVEGNLLAAAQEIDKLALLAPGARIGAAQMLDLVADASRYDVFALVDAALGGDAPRALRMLAGLRAEGEAVAALMPWLAGEVGRVAGFARIADGGGNVGAEMKAARVWDARQALYRRAMQRHSGPGWEAFALEAGRVERMAKGREAGDAWQALERLVAAIGEPRARRLVG